MLSIGSRGRHLAATLTNPSLLDKPHRISHGGYGRRLSQCHWSWQEWWMPRIPGGQVRILRKSGRAETCNLAA